MGLASNGPARIDAGILHTMQESEDEGHTNLERRELVLKSADLLDADTKDVEARIEALLLEKELVISKPDWLQIQYVQRLRIPSFGPCITKIKAHSSLPSIQVEKAIEWAQEKAGFNFAEQQVEAVKQALYSKISILTGGPGTGKTTILRALVAILQS